MELGIIIGQFLPKRKPYSTKRIHPKELNIRNNVGFCLVKKNEITKINEAA